MQHDEIVVLPSGTELSIEAARGDLSRAVEFLADGHDQYAMGLAADMEHVSELLVMLAHWAPGQAERERTARLWRQDAKP